jgi:hypothetical protein
MKNLIPPVFVLLVLLISSCSGQAAKKQAVSTTSGNDIEVYYFHMTTRCVTCRAVESEAKKNLDILYTDLVKRGKISFTALNLEEPDGKTIGDRLGVSGQTLLIVKGDQKINLTNEGFLYALSKPEKFKEIIKDKIDPLIK